MYSEVVANASTRVEAADDEEMPDCAKVIEINQESQDPRPMAAAAKRPLTTHDCVPQNPAGDGSSPVYHINSPIG